MARIIIQYILFVLSRLVIGKYKPDVIGITGSVGKTSTREAIALVLARGFVVRASRENWNTELSVPLTIFGCTTYPGKSVFRWLSVWAHALRILLVTDPSYPKILILEMAADRSGDISYLTRLAPCRIGVLTSIASAHLEEFGTIEAIRKEKMVILEALRGSNAVAIINADDPQIACPRSDVACVSFGTSLNATLRATDIVEQFSFRKDSDPFMSVTCAVSDGSDTALLAVKVAGAYHITSFLAACAVGKVYGLPLKECAKALSEFTCPPGRLSIMRGIKDTLVIDGSYNASPLSVRAALGTLMGCQLQKNARHIAVLGDMLELGSESESEHRLIGVYIANLKPEMLITVGKQAQAFAESAISHGLLQSGVISCDTAQEAVHATLSRVAPGDAILIKGSLGIALASVVQALTRDS